MTKFTWIAAIIAIAAVGYLVYAVVTKDVNVAPVISPTPLTSIDTSNWKTYRNEEYGFEVKYPEEWFVKGEKNGISLLSPRDLEIISLPNREIPVGFFITSYNVDSKAQLYEWIKSQTQASPQKENIVGLYEEYSIYTPGIVDGTFTYFMKQGNTILSVEAYYKEAFSEPIFQGILRNMKSIKRV